MYGLKSIICKCFKISLIIFVIDVLVFVLMIFFSMTDSTSPKIANILLFLLRHVLSLPLGLLNDNLPFFLDYREFPKYVFIFVPMNIVLQSIICLAAIKTYKWCLSRIESSGWFKR